jgi:23S rRNA (guanosine2251-2'-O)-methyltransferase
MKQKTISQKVSKTESMAKARKKVVVLLDNIRSAENVGSIFRTSDATGIDRIICAGITPAPRDVFQRVNTKIAKIALGAEQSVEWSISGNSAQEIKRYKKQGYTVVALEQHERSITVKELLKNIGLDALWVRQTPLLIVLGAEVDGVSSRVLSLCDYIVELPMRGSKESLNVAVAFGILVYGLFENI